MSKVIVNKIRRVMVVVVVFKVELLFGKVG